MHQYIIDGVALLKAKNLHTDCNNRNFKSAHDICMNGAGAGSTRENIVRLFIFVCRIKAVQKSTVAAILFVQLQCVALTTHGRRKCYET